MNNEIFSNIRGYESIKEELLKIREWFFDESKFNNPKVKLPRGILFYGQPGTGKTLFMKEYAASFNTKVFNVSGEEEDSPKEIKRVFDLSKEEKFSIIVIDEIDLLIDKKPDLERILQTELDGFNSKSNTLILASTNSYHTIRGPLTRAGRFDRKIEIAPPDLNSRREIIEFYLKDYELKNKIDTQFIAKITGWLSGSDLRLLVNDAYLRYGENLETSGLEESLRKVIRGNFEDKPKFESNESKITIAYHEVGHAMMIYKNRELMNFYKAYFTVNGGVTHSFTNDEPETVKRILADIEVGLGGYVINKIRVKSIDSGCIDDLQKVRELAIKLVNKIGYKGPSRILPYFDVYNRMETAVKWHQNEKQVEKIINKCHRTTYRYLKKHMKQVHELSLMMVDKGYVDANDIEKVMAKK